MYGIPALAELVGTFFYTFLSCATILASPLQDPTTQSASQVGAVSLLAGLFGVRIPFFHTCLVFLVFS